MLPWIALDTGRQQQLHQYHYGDIVVKGDVRSYVPDQTASFVGGVTATFGPDVLTSEHLDLLLAPDQLRGVAGGNVLLIDPDATIKASNLEFSWNPQNRYARATNVEMHIAGATIKAEMADMLPNRWTLTNAYFTTSHDKIPIYSVKGKTITIYPGQYAKIDRPDLSILGHHIFTWPSQTFSLNPNASGIRPPNPEYRQGSGLGVNWTSGLLLDPRMTLEGHADAYPGSRPGDGIQLTQSFVAPERNATLLAPRSELSQRFEFGYFESLEAKAPSDESGYLAQPRQSLSASSNFNAGVTGRGSTDETFSLPSELTYEVSGKAGKQIEGISDFRVETIQRLGQATLERGLWQGSLELPRLHLSPELYVISRADAAYFQGDTPFGWGRLTEGLILEPNKALRLAVAGVGAFQGGTPQYNIDPLYTKTGMAFRGDYKLGPRTFSYMTRWDEHLFWFDREFTFTQAMGAFEAYVIYRRYPGDYRYGVRLRLDQFEDLLKRRRFQRPSQADSDSP